MSNEVNDRIQELETEKKALLDEIFKFKRKPKGEIAYLLLILGMVFLLLSIVHMHQVASFIGIGIMFWGALLLYLRPVNFVRKELLDSSLFDLYDGFLRVLKAQKLEGSAIYYSPGTFGGFLKVVLFIPKENVVSLPSDDDLTEDIFFYDNPSGVRLNPPGWSLYTLFGRELRTNLVSYDFSTLQSHLENVLVNDLEIVKSFEMELDEDIVVVRIRETIFQNVLERLASDQGNIIIGDPLFSSISCALALHSRKPVIIKKIYHDSDEKSWEAEMLLVDFSVA